MCQETVKGGLWAELMRCITYSSVWISTIGGQKQADVAATNAHRNEQGSHNAPPITTLYNMTTFTRGEKM